MNIYVGNLSFEATEQDIRQEFSKFGEVSGVNMVTDRETGRSQGFCFVEMPNDAEAKEAISGLNLQRIAGRAVTVNEARQARPLRPPRLSRSPPLLRAHGCATARRGRRASRFDGFRSGKMEIPPSE